LDECKSPFTYTCQSNHNDSLTGFFYHVIVLTRIPREKYQQHRSGKPGSPSSQPSSSSSFFSSSRNNPTDSSDEASFFSRLLSFLYTLFIGIPFALIQGVVLACCLVVLVGQLTGLGHTEEPVVWVATGLGLGICLLGW
jgi:hypothetical protein